jgi:hypothetical protein
MHKDYNTPSKILDEYSELARNKAMKTRASRVNAIFEFYSTRSINFFQDKISVERVESSKMSTLVGTSVVSKYSLARALAHEYLFFDTRTHSYSSGSH